MKAIFTFMLLCICAFATYSQANQKYLITSTSGTTQYGYYEIDNGGYFIKGKQGSLNFYFVDPDYRAQYSDVNIICNGSKLVWTPSTAQGSTTITIKIRRVSDNSVIDPNVLIQLPIKPNSAPKYTYGTSEVTFSKVKDQELTINLNDYIGDDDKDPLIFKWTSNPNNFPDFINGVCTLPKTKVSTKTRDVGVVGISDGISSISLVLNVDYTVPPAAPKFIPEPNSEGNIALDQELEEGDSIVFAIKAIDVTTNADIPNIVISGQTLGLQYSNGYLIGALSYDIIGNDISEEQANASYAKTLTLLAVNSVGTTTVGVTLKIKPNGSEDDYHQYNKMRQDVDTKVQQYQRNVIDKWTIVYEDLRRVQRSSDVTDAIDLGLQGIGGVSVFSANVPLTTVVTGLSIVNDKVSGLLKRREERIKTNIQSMIKAIELIKEPVKSFYDRYKNKPENRFYLTRKGLNTMDDAKKLIDSKDFDFQQTLASVVRVTRR